MDISNLKLKLNIPSVGDIAIIVDTTDRLTKLKKYLTILPSPISINGVELRPGLELEDILAGHDRLMSED